MYAKDELLQILLEEMDLVVAGEEKYSMYDTLDKYRRMYTLLKQRHRDLPKLRKTTIREALIKCKLRHSSQNIAHCHTRGTRRICFNTKYLKTRHAMLKTLDGWKELDNEDFLWELITHEMSHFRVKGRHNKKFYRRQRQLMDSVTEIRKDVHICTS